jgi:hypothetical protein
MLAVITRMMRVIITFYKMFCQGNGKSVPKDKIEICQEGFQLHDLARATPTA